MKAFMKILSAVVFAVVLGALAWVGGNVIVLGKVIPGKDEPLKTVVEAPKEVAGAVSGTAVAEAAFDYATYSPNVDNGAKVAGKCKACHTFGNGEPDRVGPNNFGIVGAKVAHREGFAYSDAMKAKAKELPAWTEEALFAFLKDPKGYVPGTKMQFAGISNDKDRADLVAWLKTLK